MAESREFFDKVGTKVRRQRGGQEAGITYVGEAPSPPKPERQLQATDGARKWAVHHDIFWGATQTHDTLPAGLYRCEIGPLGPMLLKQSVTTDNLLELPDDASSKIIAEFDQFWKIGAAFRERGYLHKRGFLLYGPPGSGKTSTVQLLIARLIKDRDGVVLLIESPQTAAQCLSLARKIEPNRPMIAIMEDLDALVQRHGENEYLSLLDGEAQVDSIVFLGTTNYPEFLDRRFVDRPSRFDTIRYIGMPTLSARRVYLKTKEPSLTAKELDLWARRSDGFSVAHLKELIIAVKCFGQSLDEAVERLSEMHEHKPSSADSPDRLRPGFVSNGSGQSLGEPP